LADTNISVKPKYQPIYWPGRQLRSGLITLDYYTLVDIIEGYTLLMENLQNRREKICINQSEMKQRLGFRNILFRT